MDRRSALKLHHWEFKRYWQTINQIEAIQTVSTLDATSIGFNGYGKGSAKFKTERYVQQLRDTAQGKERRKKTNLLDMERKRQEKIAAGATIEEAEEAVNPLFAFFAAELGAG